MIKKINILINVNFGFSKIFFFKAQLFREIFNFFFMKKKKKN